MIIIKPRKVTIRGVTEPHRINISRDITTLCGVVDISGGDENKYILEFINDGGSFEIDRVWESIETQIKLHRFCVDVAHIHSFTTEGTFENEKFETDKIITYAKVTTSGKITGKKSHLLCLVHEFFNRIHGAGDGFTNGFSQINHTIKINYIPDTQLQHYDTLKMLRDEDICKKMMHLPKKSEHDIISMEHDAIRVSGIGEYYRLELKIHFATKSSYTKAHDALRLRKRVVGCEENIASYVRKLEE